MPETPPRLHVLVAREAPRAVVIRRGPSRYASTYLWDLRSDAFETGQWLRARIYERRCDLSPSGEHMIYFAFNGIRTSQTRGSWTAISRAPYLKALTLYAKGDAWNGGGLFTGDDSYLLNERYLDHDLLFDLLGFACVRGTLPAVYGGNNECLGVYYPRLVRDGWRMNFQRSFQHVQVFEKDWRNGVALRKYCHKGKGPRPGGVYTDSHALLSAGGEVAVFPLWEWADVIGDRLVWAEAGTILAASPRAFDPKLPYEVATALHDFNGLKFQAREAPY